MNSKDPQQTSSTFKKINKSYIERLGHYTGYLSRPLIDERFNKIIEAIESHKTTIDTTSIEDYLNSLDPTAPEFILRGPKLLGLLIEQNINVKGKDVNGKAIEIMASKIAKNDLGALDKYIKKAQQKDFINITTLLKKVINPALFESTSALTMIFYIAKNCEKDGNWDAFFNSIKNSSTIFKGHINTLYDGESLFELACRSGRRDIIYPFLYMGAKCDLKSPKSGKFPLHSIIGSTEYYWSDYTVVFIEEIFKRYPEALYNKDELGCRPLEYSSNTFKETECYAKLTKLQALTTEKDSQQSHRQGRY